MNGNVPRSQRYRTFVLMMLSGGFMGAYSYFLKGIRHGVDPCPCFPSGEHPVFRLSRFDRIDQQHAVQYVHLLAWCCALYAVLYCASTQLGIIGVRRDKAFRQESTREIVVALRNDRNVPARRVPFIHNGKALRIADDNILFDPAFLRLLLDPLRTGLIKGRLLTLVFHSGIVVS